MPVDGLNPFRGLGTRHALRADDAQPTEELKALLAACSALGEDYAPTMRALLTFEAYSGMRPGELYVLEWSNAHFHANRVHVKERVYKGALDLLSQPTLTQYWKEVRARAQLDHEFYPTA